jgi:hypothetical protein
MRRSDSEYRDLDGLNGEEIDALIAWQVQTYVWSPPVTG